MLRRHVPAAWRKSAQVAGALSILLAAGSLNGAGCKGRDVAKVAPVFMHGEGRGSAGCVMVNPPMFLSEEEALSVISDELGKAGLTMTQRNVRVDQIPVEQFRFSDKPQNAGRAKYDGPVDSLIIDLMDPQKRVAVNCVTTRNYHHAGGEITSSSVQGYNCRKVAERLGETIREAKDAPGMFYGTFYDPIVKPKDPETIQLSPQEMQELNALAEKTASSAPESERRDWERAYKEAAAGKKRHEQAWKDTQEESYGLLRAQVKDFIEWLKGQGAI